MPPPSNSRSIRNHLLGIVLIGAILPLALIGLWLSWLSVRNGRDLLDHQLAASLDSVKRSVATRWTYRQSDLASIAENAVATRAVAGTLSAEDSAYLSELTATLASTVASFRYRDSSGRIRFAASALEPAVHQNVAVMMPTSTIHLHVPIRNGGAPIGTAEVEMRLDAVLPVESSRVLVLGSILAVKNRTDSAVLSRVNGTMPFPSGRNITIDGVAWSARIDSLVDPPLDLAVAAPTAPYVKAYQNAAWLGLLALVVVALLAVLLTNYLNARLVRSVVSLVDAADAVAGGDLSRRAGASGPAELQQLAGAFNTMTESLRRLVAELSQRRALAAVGEFAASLSHEVRNALTAVQLDLERVDEQMESPRNRELLTRALGHVRRLDAAVTGSLRIARSGRNEFVPVAIADVIHRTAEAAEPSFVSVGMKVMIDAADANATLPGDAEALHQMFLNLLLNAQQAMEHGGLVTIAMQLSDQRVVITITDTGRGMTGDEIAHAFEPYFTTRTKGTGLGLPIARMIAEAHGGEIRLVSDGGHGTTVTVDLPQTRQPSRGYQPQARS